MKRYDSYKDSGVEWIGEIPSSWELCRLKYLCSVSTGNRDTQDKVEDGKYPFFVRSPIVERINSYSYEGESVLTVGDGVGTGKVFHYYNGKFEFHQRVYKFSDFDKVLGKYFFEFMKNKFINVTEDQNSKSTVDSLRRPLIDNFIFCFPSLFEQLQIVDYLDTKTSMIDSLIEKTQRKIELLKEKRTSLINEVVTKGLNPNVEMKDSGVEWIGEIPKHWELRKGSTIGYYSKGNGIKKDEVREMGLPCIRYGEIYTKFNHKFERVETFIDEGITDVKVSSGTLFITGSGELLEEIGKCVVYVGKEELYVGGDIIILKPFSFFDSEFLSYQINSECIRIQRELSGRGGIIVHIYSKNFKDMWFPIPSLSEQQEIVSYLDEQTYLIDKTMSIEERKIELLKEYRQSLISEVVTGKVKVTTDEHT